MKYKKPKSVVARDLHAKGDLFEQRNALYGDNYLRFGNVLLALFPKGAKLETSDDMNRFALFCQITAKLSRYSNNFARGGHDDGLDDTSVYAMMLKEVDGIIRSKKKVRRK